MGRIIVEVALTLGLIGLVVFMGLWACLGPRLLVWIKSQAQAIQETVHRVNRQEQLEKERDTQDKHELEEALRELEDTVNPATQALLVYQKHRSNLSKEEREQMRREVLSISSDEEMEAFLEKYRGRLSQERENLNGHQR